MSTAFALPRPAFGTMGNLGDARLACHSPGILAACPGLSHTGRAPSSLLPLAFGRSVPGTGGSLEGLRGTFPSFLSHLVACTWRRAKRALGASLLQTFGRRSLVFGEIRCVCLSSALEASLPYPSPVSSVMKAQGSSSVGE